MASSWLLLVRCRAEPPAPGVPHGRSHGSLAQLHKAQGPGGRPNFPYPRDGSGARDVFFAILLKNMTIKAFDIFA